MRIVTDRRHERPGDLVIPGWAAHPDRLPSTPSAGDDEFDVPSSGWTLLNSSYFTYDFGDTLQSHLTFSIPQGTANKQLSGIYKPIPMPAPFTVTAKGMALTTPSAGTANFLGAGLGVCASTPGSAIIVEHTEQTINTLAFEMHSWSNPSTYNDPPVGDFDPGTGGYGLLVPFWLRLVVPSATAIDGYGSTDGLLFRQINRTTTYNVGSLGAVGLFNIPSEATGFRISWGVAWDWLRFRPGTADPEYL